MNATANDSGLNLDHLEAKFKAAYVDTYIHPPEDNEPHAERCRVWWNKGASAALANQPAPTVPAGDYVPVEPLLHFSGKWLKADPLAQDALSSIVANRSVAHQPAQEQAGPTWGIVETVGDMVRNLLTLDQAAPIFTAFHVTIDGQRRCRTRGVTISRERVVDGKWIDSARKDVPYANIVWAKPDERVQQEPVAAPQQAAAPGAQLCIGVAAPNGATISIMQPHADGTTTMIYGGTHPAGDSMGRAVVAASPGNSPGIPDSSNSAPGTPEAPADTHLPGWERGIATVTMSGRQLREALDFINPDGDDDEDQRENELTFGIVQHKDDDGKATTGLCCWNDDSDGVLPLDSEPRAAQLDGGQGEGQ